MATKAKKGSRTRLEIYLAQRGIEVPVIPAKLLQNMQVKDLRATAEQLGCTLRARETKADLMSMIRKNEKAFGIAKCTPRQQRRLRKKGIH